MFNEPNLGQISWFSAMVKVSLPFMEFGSAINKAHIVVNQMGNLI